MHASTRVTHPAKDLPADNNQADEDIALIAKALSHPARIQIIRLLLSKKPASAATLSMWSAWPSRQFQSICAFLKPAASLAARLPARGFATRLIPSD